MRLFRILTTLCFALCVAAGYATQLPPDIVKSEVIVFINGQKFYVHTVKGGETLYSIAKAYEVSEDVIKEHNRGLGETLNIDQTLKIPDTEKKAEKRKKKDFIQLRPDEHDRRCKRIHVLPKGKECMENMHQVIQNNEKRLVEGFTAEEQALFADFLNRAIANMGASPCRKQTHKEENSQ